MITATPIAVNKKSLAAFNLNEDEYRVLKQIANRPRRTAGFSVDAVDYLLLRHLVTASNRGRLLMISTAGKGSLEAIELLN
jgi:hypothetical protein